jgi:hypothetical protein
VDLIQPQEEVAENDVNAAGDDEVDVIGISDDDD